MCNCGYSGEWKSCEDGGIYDGNNSYCGPCNCDCHDGEDEREPWLYED